MLRWRAKRFVCCSILLYASSINYATGAACDDEACDSVDETGLLHLAAKTSRDWPDVMGKLKDITGTISKGHLPENAIVDTLVDSLTSQANKTLDAVGAKADELLSFATHASSDLQQTIFEAQDDKLLRFRSLVNETLHKAMEIWTPLAASFKTTALMIEKGIGAIAGKDITSKVTKVLDTATEKADGFGMSLATATDTIAELVNKTAPQVLLRLNATLRAASKDVKHFDESFKEAFKELTVGLVKFTDKSQAKAHLVTDAINSLLGKANFTADKITHAADVFLGGIMSTSDDVVELKSSAGAQLSLGLLAIVAVICAGSGEL